MADDHPQHVIEIVRHAARQTPDGLHFLCLLQLRLQVHPFLLLLPAHGDVASDSQYAHEASIRIEHRGLDGFEKLLVAIGGEGDLLLVHPRTAGGHCGSVIGAEEIRQFPVKECVVRLTDDVVFRRANKALEPCIAGKIDTL